jgi:hypothetical protein
MATQASTVFFILFPIFSLISIRSIDGIKTHYTII